MDITYLTGVLTGTTAVIMYSAMIPSPYSFLAGLFIGAVGTVIGLVLVYGSALKEINTLLSNNEALCSLAGKIFRLTLAELRITSVPPPLQSS